ncbi:hypothetical protein [Mycobacterium marinum]|uniref:hypothetical protein n=1 Tax=Mycobacterium marinum TaxID=1781 RepID=UPI00113FC57B|nr:hypothetical protein [Mycobacterium marinum]
MERDWERLSRAVLDRRTTQRWTQQEVWDRGGPSDTLQSDIEAGRWKPTRNVKQTLRKIDDGLEWTPGSAAQVLAGGDPTPIDSPDRVLVSKYHHPSASVARGRSRGFVPPDTLERIASGDQLVPKDREALQRLLDDADIERFPQMFAELNRGNKLEVVAFAKRRYFSELEGSVYVGDCDEDQEGLSGPPRNLGSSIDRLIDGLGSGDDLEGGA